MVSDGGFLLGSWKHEPYENEVKIDTCLPWWCHSSKGVG